MVFRVQDYLINILTGKRRPWEMEKSWIIDLETRDCMDGIRFIKYQPQIESKQLRQHKIHIILHLFMRRRTENAAINAVFLI